MFDDRQKRTKAIPSEQLLIKKSSETYAVEFKEQNIEREHTGRREK